MLSHILWVPTNEQLQFSLIGCDEFESFDETAPDLLTPAMLADATIVKINLLGLEARGQTLSNGSLATSNVRKWHVYDQASTRGR
jgi:hypothetical protein